MHSCALNIKFLNYNKCELHVKGLSYETVLFAVVLSGCIRQMYLIDPMILNVSGWNPSGFSHWQGSNKPIRVWPLPIFPTSAALTTSFITQLCNHSKLPHPFYCAMMLGFFALLLYALCLERPSQPHCSESYSALKCQAVQEFLNDWQPQQKELSSLILTKSYFKLFQKDKAKE